MKQKIGHIEWKKVFIGILIILGFYVVAPIVVGYIYGFFFDLKQDFHVIVGTLLTYLLILLFLIFYYRKSLIADGKKWIQNWKSNIRISFITWLKALVFMMISNLIVISITGGIAGNEEQNRSIISMYPIFSLITMIGIGPFMEEMLFRRGFKDAFSKNTTFCFFTAFLFGLAHVSGVLDFSSFSSFVGSLPELLFLIPYGGIGYFFAKAYCETDTIFTSTITHVIHNTFAVVISLIGA